MRGRQLPPLLPEDALELGSWRTWSSRFLFAGLKYPLTSGSVLNEITNICVLTVALLPVLDVQISLHRLLDFEPDQSEQRVLGQSQSLAGRFNQALHLLEGHAGDCDCPPPD